MKNVIVSLFSVAIVLAAGSASATRSSLPAPQDTREFFTVDEQIPFDEFPDPRIKTERLFGKLNGAAYRIEVPENWNGELVMWAHGFFGNVPQLFADTHPFRTLLISQGFAWAASSYTKNYYDVRSGVKSTNDLVRFFAKEVGEPSRVFITGASMGGHVTAAAVEQFPNYQCPEGSRYSALCERIVNVLGRISGGVKYSGALPVCGVMGDKETLSFGTNYRLVAEQLAGVPNQFPTSEDYISTVVPFVASQLFNFNAEGQPIGITAKGIAAREYLRNATGGDRPGFDQSFLTNQPTLIGAGLGDGTFSGVTGANVFDNRRLTYQLDADAAVSVQEQELNENILRVRRNRFADPEQFLKLERIPTITGRLTVPMVTLHTTGDMLVPFHNQQVYAKRVAARGASEFLVQRAVRDTGHCTFDPVEAGEAFGAMYAWATFGVKPAGDDVLTPDVVADENYGCQFTRRTRSELGIAACPGVE